MINTGIMLMERLLRRWRWRRYLMLLAEVSLVLICRRLRILDRSWSWSLGRVRRSNWWGRRRRRRLGPATPRFAIRPTCGTNVWWWVRSFIGGWRAVWYMRASAAGTGWYGREPLLGLQGRRGFGRAILGPRNLVGIALADEAASSAVVACRAD